ncbi:hypothetical protein [Catellatospora sp. NPDC049609]|uniref:hypothetical protein n=1 Tax=Catellatospora sp. NPDC049609 TaxID=3155505 RepID=UPI003430F43F
MTAHQLAHRINAQGTKGKGLARQLDRAGREASGDIVAAVTNPTNTAPYLPRGYEDVLARSLRTKTEVRLLRERTITVVVWAEGKRYRRHLDRIDAGTLKHPVFGRGRRLRARSPLREKFPSGRYPNPWVAQTLRSGVISRTGASAMPRAVQRFQNAAARIATEIERG